jgi:hypothetical protein
MRGRVFAPGRPTQPNCRPTTRCQSKADPEPNGGVAALGPARDNQRGTGKHSYSSRERAEPTDKRAIARADDDGVHALHGEENRQQRPAGHFSKVKVHQNQDASNEETKSKEQEVKKISPVFGMQAVSDMRGA